MKLYKNISRFQFRRRFPKGSTSEKKLLWGATLKVGDVVSTCCGWNARIEKITPHVCGAHNWIWGSDRTSAPRRNKDGWYIDGFILDSAGGYMHYTDSCCWPRRSVERIEADWLGTSEEYLVGQERLGWDVSHTRLIQDALRLRKRVFDDDGVLLAEFMRT